MGQTEYKTSESVFNYIYKEKKNHLVLDHLPIETQDYFHACTTIRSKLHIKNKWKNKSDHSCYD